MARRKTVSRAGSCLCEFLRTGAGEPADAAVEHRRFCEDVARQPKTFLYQFDWESPARGGQLGACHGLEVPFVWGMIGKNSTTNFSGTGEAANHLAEQMMDAWIAFAKSG